jgi:hypothetical protein
MQAWNLLPTPKGSSLSSVAWEQQRDSDDGEFSLSSE